MSDSRSLGGISIARLEHLRSSDRTCSNPDPPPQKKTKQQAAVSQEQFWETTIMSIAEVDGCYSRGSTFRLFFFLDDGDS